MQFLEKMSMFGLLMMLVAFQPLAFARPIPSNSNDDGLGNVANGVNTVLQSEELGLFGAEPYTPRNFEGVEGGSKVSQGEFWMEGRKEITPETSIVQMNGESVNAHEEYHWAPCPPAAPPGNFCYRHTGEEDHSSKEPEVQGVERVGHFEGHWGASCPPGTPPGNFCYGPSGAEDPREDHSSRKPEVQGVERVEHFEGHWASCPPDTPDNFCYGPSGAQDPSSRAPEVQSLERKLV